MTTFLDTLGLIKSSCINADDTCILARIWCDRDDTRTAPTIAVNSSGDLLGTTNGTTACADFLEFDGTAGTIDVSDTNADTFQEVQDTVNNAKGWHFQLVGARGDESADDTINALTEADCGGVGRAQDLLDDTSITKRYRIGITAKSPGVRDSDEGFINEILSIRVIGTFSTGTGILYIWECDDEANEYELRYQFALTTATEKALDERQIHIQSKPGNRLLVSMTNSAAAVATASLVVRHRTFRVEH